MLDTTQMDMVGRIGHEVGNAVTIIKCSLNIMKNKTPDLGNTSFFSIALDEVDYMEKLMKDIMEYRNVSRLNLEKTDIVDFTKECVEMGAKINKDCGNENNFNENNLNVIKTNVISLESGMCVMLDKIKYKEMIVNLIKNSIEAINIADRKEGKIEVRIKKVNVSSQNDYVKIEIEDNGCGIKENHILDIFEPMVTYKQGGTGLGLAIAKEVVEAHGGKIKVISTENVGTTFVIKLPIEN